jgi:hypothetical protein
MSNSKKQGSSKLTIETRYGVVPNDILNNTKLTFKAKGLWVYIQSKPDGWQFSARRMAGQSKDGRDGVLSGLRELVDAGLLEYHRYKDDKGQWRHFYTLREKPPHTRPLYPRPENPDAVMPDVLVKKNQKTRNSKKEESAKGEIPIDLDEEIKLLESSERRDENIVALYLDKKRPDLRTKAQLGVAVRRHLRAAKQLEGFTNAQILKGVDRAEAEYKEVGWTLETIVKILTK